MHPTVISVVRYSFLTLELTEAMDLDLSMKRRSTVSSEQARNIIQSISALRTMFEGCGDYKGDLFGDYDTTHGMLYLSRLNTVEHRPTTHDDEQDGEINKNYDEGAQIETKSTSTVTMSASTREKKRQFAMSLSTLAMKPHKREIIVEEGAVASLNDLSAIEDVIIRRLTVISSSILKFVIDFVLPLLVP